MAKLLLPRVDIEALLPLNEKGIAKLALFGTPVESITENQVELEISANRPDLLSAQGLTRALKPFIGKETPSYSAKKSKAIVKVDKAVKSVRPYTTCALIQNIILDEEKIKQIIQIQEKLHASIGRGRKKVAIGIYPADKITFPVTYTAKAPKDISFRPLGMPKEMTAMQILEKHPAGKEYGDLLKNQSKYPFFIDANKKILSLPPIINSEEMGRVDTNTTQLFVECSGDNKHALKKTLAILVAALADMGGSIHEITIEDEKKEISPDLAWEERKLTPGYANKILGLDLKEKQIFELLEKMGHKVKGSSILVAPWRADVLHEIDLVEDIAIAYGYDKLIPTIPSISTIGQEDQLERFKATLNDLALGLGYSQIMTHHLVTLEESRLMKEQYIIEVENSKSDFTVLRPDLIISMLRTLAHNTDAEYPQKLLELGRVFKKDDSDELGVREEEHLVCALSPGNFTEAKQLADYLARMLNLTLIPTHAKKEGFIEGRTAALKINDQNIGFIGEVHPNTLRAWHIKMPLAMLELNIDLLYKATYPK